jgi:hypothetical protein
MTEVKKFQIPEVEIKRFQIPETEIKRFQIPEGLTVKRLKEILANWSETHEDGTPCEIWVTTGNCESTQVNDIWPLNAHYDNSEKMSSADLLLDARMPNTFQIERQ